MTDRQKQKQGEEAVKNVKLFLDKSNISTQRELEKRLGYSYGSLSVALQRVKKGNLSALTLDKWLLMTEIFDCKISDLLGDI